MVALAVLFSPSNEQTRCLMVQGLTATIPPPPTAQHSQVAIRTKPKRRPPTITLEGAILAGGGREVEPGWGGEERGEAHILALPDRTAEREGAGERTK